MNELRIQEILGNMASFEKESYEKREILTEMFALQQEMVGLTFNGDHATTADLKIWDVEKHLEQLNRDCGNVADKELKRFEEESKAFCNLIRAEVSGSRGEAKAFRTLQFIRSNNIILKNVELRDGDVRTELDAVVITPGTVTIVEVKNTSKNIFIDENGDYFRTGEFLKLDCNIAEKITLKEELLRKVLAKEGITDIQIRSIVVFTDNRIEVQNKYPRLRTCFVSQLAYVIDGLKSDRHYSLKEMQEMESIIREAECKGTYPFDFDVAQYKRDFATVMVILEEASAKEEEAGYEEEEVIEPKAGVWESIKGYCTSERARKLAKAAAAVTFVSTVALSVIRRGGLG